MQSFMGTLFNDLDLAAVDFRRILEFRILKQACFINLGLNQHTKQEKQTHSFFIFPQVNIEFLFIGGQKVNGMVVKYLLKQSSKGLIHQQGLLGKNERGKIIKENLVQYEFTVEKNNLNYLGTWHFDTGLVSFSDDKIQLDKEMNSKYKTFDFENAIIRLPK